MSLNQSERVDFKVEHIDVSMYKDGTINFCIDGKSIEISCANLLFVIQEYQERFGRIPAKISPRGWKGWISEVEK